MPQRIIIGEGGVEGLVIELVFHGAYLGKGGGGGGGGTKGTGGGGGGGGVGATKCTGGC